MPFIFVHFNIEGWLSGGAESEPDGRSAVLFLWTAAVIIHCGLIYLVSCCLLGYLFHLPVGWRQRPLPVSPAHEPCLAVARVWPLRPHPKAQHGSAFLLLVESCEENSG